MRRLLMMIGGLVLAVAGCRDGVMTAERAAGPGPAFAASSAALAGIGPGWRTHADDPHACFTSIAGGSGRFRYRRLSLRFPSAARSADGAVAAFRYRRVRNDGSVVAVLNCVIPANARAREMVARQFRVADEPGADGVTTQSCPEGGCELPGIEWGACRGGPIYGAWPECSLYEPCAAGIIDCTPSGGTSPEPGEGGSGCTNCGPNRPTVSCSPLPVTRGSTVNCVLVIGSTRIRDGDVAGWAFSDGANTITGRGGNAEWAGTAVQSGTVTATLTDGSSTDGTLTVNPRGWTWAANAESGFSSGTGVACLDHTPTYGSSGAVLGAANGVNIPLGWTNCTTTQRQIQPDSYALAGDGFTAATVASGPNRGMHFIQSARLRLLRESTLNLGMFPSAPRVPLQDQQLAACGKRENGFHANWHEFSRCMGADPDAYIAGVRAHEGYGTNGHNGHFSAAYDAVANPSVDPMIFLDNEVGSNGDVIGNFVEDTRRRFYTRAEQAEIATRDVTLGGTIVRGNWSGTYWGWVPGSSRFASSNHSI